MGTDQELLVPVETYKNHIRPRICELEVPWHQGMALSIESAASSWGVLGCVREQSLPVPQRSGFGFCLQQSTDIQNQRTRVPCGFRGSL